MLILVIAKWHRIFRIRRLLVFCGVALLAGCLVVTGSAVWVSRTASARVFRADSVPQRPVGLVFGSQVHADGSPSLVLAHRLNMALRLYRAGKIQAILVSGDNGRVAYNEVDPMRKWLIERGVPDRRVVGDYAGFDTYNSCVRAVRIFGVRSAVLVTQRYHLSRAVAVCDAVGIDAVGVAAGTGGIDDLTLRRLALRDQLACVKAVGELIVRPDPTFLGPRETGIDQALAD